VTHFEDTNKHRLSYVHRHTYKNEVTRPPMGFCQYCGLVRAAKERPDFFEVSEDEE